MEYERFLQEIRFHDMEPMTEHIAVNYDVHSRETLRAAQKRFRAIDVHAADLPEDKEAFEAMLKPALKVPRMSTFANGAIIARTVQEMAPGTSYVNVGIWNGFSFFAGMVAGPDRTVVGIDNFSQFGGPKDQAMAVFERLKGPQHSFYDMDYRDYFSHVHEGEIGFYFYDGEHSYENQLQGLKVAEPYFSKDCIVLVDDTNWEEPRQATLDFVAQSSNTYRMLFDEKTAWNGHPTYWNGLMLLRREG